MFDFKEDKILKQRPIWFPELDIKYEPESVCLAACTEPVRITENKNCLDFHQNFQVSISLAHQKRVKIVEFMVSWGEQVHEDDAMVTFLLKEVEIQHVGSKEFILKKRAPGKIEDSFAPQLLPLLDE